MQITNKNKDSMFIPITTVMQVWPYFTTDDDTGAKNPVTKELPGWECRGCWRHYDAQFPFEHNCQDPTWNHKWHWFLQKIGFNDK